MNYTKKLIWFVIFLCLIINIVHACTIGERDSVTKQYCGLDETWQPQKADKAECQNNFECLINSCKGEICQDFDITEITLPINPSCSYTVSTCPSWSTCSNNQKYCTITNCNTIITACSSSSSPSSSSSTDECDGDSDCETDEICEDDECIDEECSDDEDCNNNEDCKSGRCKIKPICGNNKKETGEVCDGTDLTGKNCFVMGFSSGTLRCANCISWNTAGCVVNIPQTSAQGPSVCVPDCSSSCGGEPSGCGTTCMYNNGAYCEGDGICEDGSCVKRVECQSNSDCNTNEYCEGNKCWKNQGANTILIIFIIIFSGIIITGIIFLIKKLNKKQPKTQPTQKQQPQQPQKKYY